MQDFRVQTFLTVCETMNYTKAADRLSITQPAVSQHIAFLEKTYKTKLFERQGKYLMLTQTGVLLRDSFCSMRNDEVRLQREIAHIEGGQRVLNVGVTLSVGEYVVSDALCDFALRHPETALKIVEGDTQVILDAVNAGELDCALVEGHVDKAAYSCRTLCIEPFLGVCAPDCNLADGRKVVFDDLRDYRLLVREQGSGTRAMLENALQRFNLSIDAFPHTIQISSINIIKHFVRRNVGVAFLYRAVVKDGLEDGTLIPINVQGMPLSHDFTFVWPRVSVFDGMLSAFCDELMEGVS